MSTSCSLAVMPKPKPDQVIRHEIALSRPAQEAIDQYVVAHSFRSFATPTVDLMKDVSGMVVFLSVIAAIGYNFEFIATGSDTTVGVLEDFRKQRAAARQSPSYTQEYRERASSFTGGLQNVYNQIIDSLSGAALENTPYGKK